MLFDQQARLALMSGRILLAYMPYQPILTAKCIHALIRHSTLLTNAPVC